MTNEKKIEERSLELRSEKVRSIVGQIPPALTRYGITITGVVLLIFLGIAYYIPYKQVYSGTITFYEVTEPSTTAYITFANNKDLTYIDEPLPLIVHTEGHDCTIKLISIVNERDTLNRYPVSIEDSQSITNLKNRTFDFTIVKSSESLLCHFLPKKVELGL